MKKAIIFAAHGSKNRSARSALGNILSMAKENYPDVLIQSAFTSGHVLKKLKEKGQPLPSLKQTLQDLSSKGVSHVVLQSLHVIPGTEFTNLSRLTKRVENGEFDLQKAVLGAPLLTNDQEIDEVSDMVLNLLAERNPETDALILVAHGSKYSDSGNGLYDKFKHVLEAKDKNAYLGKLNSKDGVVKISEQIKESGIKKAFLVPLLFGAGNHVKKDMDGPQEDSWKNIVAKCGIEVVTIARGIGEYDAFARRWMDNLQKAFDKLEN